MEKTTQAPDNDFSHLQDVMGALPMLKRYVVFCLAFSLDDATSITTVQDSLHKALQNLSVAFPYMTGQVVYEGQREGKSGNPKIIPLGDSIKLITKDLSRNLNFPSMAQLKKANFPFSALDGNTIAPPIAFTWANFLSGGLLLQICGNHTQMDMTGMGGIISHLAKACRNEPFTAEELTQGNQARGSAIPLLGSNYNPGPELNDVFTRLLPSVDLSSAPRWSYFNFSAASLALLKAEASKQTIVPYSTTDDALCALIWQRISAVRQSRFGANVLTRLARTVSLRRWLGLQGYLGHMVDCVYESCVDVYDRPIGEIAGRLRRIAAQDEEITYHARAYATMLERLDDKSQLINGANLDFNKDICISSYANVKYCDLDFGPILGKPEAGRRPKMAAWPGLFYVMPKSRNDDMAVGFCVSESDLEELRKDDVLLEYAEFVG